MDGESLDINQDKIKKLLELFPEAGTEGKIDWEKLRASLGDNIDFTNERYVLNWAGKSDAFRTLQTPTTATLVPDKDESVNFDTTENLFIEGENLEVLKILQKSYFNKVKMIYIDPPYNTGNDHFIYPDKFAESKEEYLKRIGDKDEQGYLMKEGLFRKNSKESGHFHSNWLSMMYPRLFLARNLLRNDGVIFVSIDDNEVHNLRLMMNEIFGEENFVAELVWKSRQNKDNRNITGASIDHEYILVYGRKLRGSERKLKQYQNPDNDPRGDWASGNMVGLLPEEQRPNCHYNLVNPKTGINYGKPKMGWRYDKNTMNRLIEEDKILWPLEENGRPRRKLFLSELKDNYTGFSSIIGAKIYTRNATSTIEKLFGFRVFEFSKPVEIIKELIEQGAFENDLILDFFSGSSPTAQAVHELNQDKGNRKFIMVQLPEKTDENSEAYKAGYKTIADIGKERIRRVIKKLEAKQEEQKKKQEGQLLKDEDAKPQDLGFKVFKLKPSNFKIWRSSDITNGEELQEQLNAFTDPVRPGAEEENILYELILKSGYELTAKIERLESNGTHYYVISDEMLMVLDSINEALAEEIIARKPQKAIMLDRLFEGNDQLKTNTSLQMRDAGIDFVCV